MGRLFAVSDSVGTVSSFIGVKLVTLAHTGALTAFQTKLTIAHEVAMQAAFGCIRFTTLAGAHIPYWLESKTDSDTADVWVKNDYDSGDTLVWMYYGNSGLSSGSDGINTFDVFGDKNDYSTHFNSNGASVSGDYIRVGVAGTDSWGVNYLVAKTALDRTTQGYVAEFLLKGTGTDISEDETMFGFATDNALTTPQCDFAYQANSKLDTYEDGVLSAPIDTITWTDDNTYRIEYPINTGAEFFVSGVSKRNSSAYASDPGKLRITPYSGPVDVKHLFVRQYAETEPTYVIGPEMHQRRPPQYI